MIVRHERGGATWVALADNLMDLVGYLRSSERHWDVTDARSTRRTDTWDLSAGYDGAMRMAHDGWSDGARDLSQLLQAADIRNDKETIERWDIAGHEPDVARYLAGNPAHMRRRTRNPEVTRAPVLSLIYNITANAHISARSLALMGSAMAAIVDQLETRGRRVDLTAAFVARTRGGRATVAWKVKRPEDQMDLSAVAFSIAHPAALRRLSFAALERSPRHWQAPGYGWSDAIKIEELPIDQDTMVIQGLSVGGCPTSVLSAVNMLAGQINAAAGEDLVEVTVKL